MKLSITIMLVLTATIIFSLLDNKDCFNQTPSSIYNDDIRFGVQSFAESTVDENVIYALSLSGVSSGNKSTIHKFQRDTVMKHPVSRSVGSGEIFGHQGLFSINEQGKDRLYSTSFIDKRYVVSAIYNSSDEFSHIKYLEVFDSSFSKNLSSTPSISKYGDSFIVQGSKKSERYLREYEIATNNKVYETKFDEGLLLGKPVQGLAVDEHNIYIIAGDNSVERNKIFITIDKGTGGVLNYKNQYSPFIEYAEEIENSVYEPEGMTWINGELYIGIVYGSIGNRKTKLIRLDSSLTFNENENWLNGIYLKTKDMVKCLY